MINKNEIKILLLCFSIISFVLLFSAFDRYKSVLFVFLKMLFNFYAFRSQFCTPQPEQMAAVANYPPPPPVWRCGCKSSKIIAFIKF